MDHNSYTAIARVYDRLNKEIDYAAWADFFEACFDRYLPTRPTLLLDLACGTGSMTVELAKRGYDMIGVDGSCDMLSEAFGRSAGRQILYLEQDMRNFELYGTVGAVTCCLDSLNYLPTEDDLRACFACVHNYLDPNGLFLFDVNTPYKFEHVYGNNAYVLEDEIDYGEGDTGLVYCGWQNFYDSEHKTCEFDLSLFEEMPDGSYRRSDEQQHEYCYDLDTLKALLADTGFELLGVWSDYRFSPIEETTPRWYFATRAIKN
ncbi:MAG: class I SAM-dependent methyltransferase [Clostridia bacterium]|nr:class I SAM-dependent methyltransferase [Clostridia bacterium]